MNTDVVPDFMWMTSAVDESLAKIVNRAVPGIINDNNATDKNYSRSPACWVYPEYNDKRQKVMCGRYGFPTDSQTVAFLIANKENTQQGSL